VEAVVARAVAAGALVDETEAELILAAEFDSASLAKPAERLGVSYNAVKAEPVADRGARAGG